METCGPLAQGCQVCATHGTAAILSRHHLHSEAALLTRGSPPEPGPAVSIPAPPGRHAHPAAGSARVIGRGGSGDMGLALERAGGRCTPGCSHIALFMHMTPQLVSVLPQGTARSTLTSSTALAAKSGVPTKSRGSPAFSGAHLRRVRQQAQQSQGQTGVPFVGAGRASARRSIHPTLHHLFYLSRRQAVRHGVLPPALTAAQSHSR